MRLSAADCQQTFDVLLSRAEAEMECEAFLRARRTVARGWVPGQIILFNHDAVGRCSKAAALSLKMLKVCEATRAFEERDAVVEEAEDMVYFSPEVWEEGEANAHRWIARA